MAKIFIHSGAQEDLERLWECDEPAAATIDALLQEAKSDSSILELFTAHDFGAYSTERFHVSKWFEQQNKGRNLWRLKIWELEKAGARYRVIYALNPLSQSYYILGVVNREFEYDETQPITQRILAAYERIGIPTFSAT